MKMKMMSHVIQEPVRAKMIWYPRWFFKLYIPVPDNDPHAREREILSGYLEFMLSKPTSEFGINIEVGTRGSETPFDGYLKIAGTTLYWGLKQGGRLADRITQRWCTRTPMALACLDDYCDCPPKYPTGSVKKHPNGENRYEGRRLQIRTSDARLWLEIWTRKHGWKRGEFANWRSRSVKLNPLDVILGDRRYWHDNIEIHQLYIDMPEDIYPVQATLQRVTHGRPKGRKTSSWSVSVDANECKGIPDHYDSSGGWKGDRVQGFEVALKQGHRPDWHIDAKAAIEAHILKSRADSGFREPLPLDI